MPEFNRDQVADWYAHEHLKTDPGVRAVYYLPRNAPEREIRFIEINELLADRDDRFLQPIDFGVDLGGQAEHRLFVLDVTPAQWERIQHSLVKLPPGWSLEEAVAFNQNGR